MIVCSIVVGPSSVTVALWVLYWHQQPYAHLHYIVGRLVVEHLPCQWSQAPGCPVVHYSWGLTFVCSPCAHTLLWVVSEW